MVQDSGFKVLDVGFRVLDFSFGYQGLECRGYDKEFGFRYLGFGV
jgi:hypothetical protein